MLCYHFLKSSPLNCCGFSTCGVALGTVGPTTTIGTIAEISAAIEADAAIVETLGLGATIIVCIFQPYNHQITICLQIINAVTQSRIQIVDTTTIMCKQ